MPTALASHRHQVADLAEAIELCYAKGWTDGLPVVPPTPDRVEAMLAAARLAPDHQVTYVAHRAVSVTAEKVAINAVMAGCRPEYMPVVVAAVEGIGDPRWSYHGPGTSTAGAGVLLIVNGPGGAGAGRERRRQPLRTGLAVEPHDRARRAPGDAERLRLAARHPRPGDARPPRKALLRDRRERGREPVAAAPRGAGLPAGPEHGHRRGGGGAAAVLQPALEHRRGGADHPRRRHADLGQRGPAALRRRPRRRAHAHDRRRRLDEGDDPGVPLRAHAELARTPQAHAPVGRRGPAGRRERRCAPWSSRPTTSSSWRPAAGRAPSPATSRAGPASAPPRP